jgi:hypothetical protein
VVDGFTGDDPELVENRRRVLGTITSQLDVINRQDSMLKIAAMPEAEREAFVRKLVRQLRKQSGLKEEESSSNSGDLLLNEKNAPTDLLPAIKANGISTTIR